MIYDPNILKMRTAINKQIIETIPDRKSFEDFQEKRLAHAIGEDIHSKIKFSWEDDDVLYTRVLTGEVVVLHVDEYKKLLKTLKKYEEITGGRFK